MEHNKNIKGIACQPKARPSTGLGWGALALGILRAGRTQSLTRRGKRGHESYFLAVPVSGKPLDKRQEASGYSAPLC